MVLDEATIKARRDMERDRIQDLVRRDHIDIAYAIVHTLNWVLEDD